jgi:hypothetical protein
VACLGELVSFSTIKFFNNRKPEVLIPKYGNIHLLNAGRLEAAHKTVKQAYKHTNRQPGAVLDQVRHNSQKSVMARKINVRLQ